MIWRVRYEIAGGHVHCRLFSAKQRNQTFAKCGEFTVRAEEFAELPSVMSGVEFIDDTKAARQREAEWRGYERKLTAPSEWD